MKRYLIENAKCDLTDVGMGPGSPNIAAAVQFKSGRTEKWLSMVEVDGIPNFYLTKQDIFDKLVEEDYDDEDFWESLEEQQIEEFNDIEFGCDYVEVFDSIYADEDNPAVPLIKYLIALVRADMDDVKVLIEQAKGKYVDELDIPITDVEEEYQEDED